MGDVWWILSPITQMLSEGIRNAVYSRFFGGHSFEVKIYNPRRERTHCFSHNDIIGDSDGLVECCYTSCMIKHRVIVVPGLGDEGRQLEWLIKHWKRYGLVPVVYRVGWRDKGSSFHPRLARLIRLIDRYSKRGERVSLVGLSAGGSAVINAFVRRRRIIHKVITVCSRLQRGQERGFRSFTTRTASSAAFAQFVALCEYRVQKLSTADRKKIMTVRAGFGDELVPGNTSAIDGAYNITVPSVEHVVSIAAALTIFSRPLIAFLHSEQSA